MTGNQVAPARAAPVPRMTLANIVTGTIRKPMRLLVYGVDGIGKSTFAAHSEAPVFIGAEDGTATLQVPRFPQPRSWAEVFEAVRTLEAGEHKYRTVVIDTLDWLEPHCWAHVVRNAGVSKDGSTPHNIEDIPFGRGYVVALDEWRLLCSRLDQLRASRNMQVILIAHSWIKPYRNPEGDDYDRFEIKLHKAAQGLLREWVDAVLFATHEQYTHKDKSDKRARAKGISTGARILHCERTAAFDAKNRYNLPKTLPLDWGALREAVEAGQSASPDELRASIEELLASAKPELAKRVRVSVAAAKDDTLELVRINNTLTAQLNIAAEKQETKP